MVKIWNADDAGLLWQNADGDGFAKAKGIGADFLEHGLEKFEKSLSGFRFQVSSFWNTDWRNYRNF